MLATTSEWDVFMNLTTGLLICLGLGIVAFMAYSMFALEKGRPIIPWGQRNRAAKAQDDVKVAEARLRTKAVELQELVLDAKHTEVMKAIEEKQPITQDLMRVPRAVLTDGRPIAE